MFWVAVGLVVAALMHSFTVYIVCVQLWQMIREDIYDWAEQIGLYVRTQRRHDQEQLRAMHKMYLDLMGNMLRPGGSENGKGKSENNPEIP